MPERHVIIEALSPCIDGGRHAAKGVAGTSLTVSADVFRDGQEALRAVLKWRKQGSRRFTEVEMVHLGNDCWQAAMPLGDNGFYEYTVEAWTDCFGTWLDELGKKVEAGEQVVSEIAEGVGIINSAASKARSSSRKDLVGYGEQLAARSTDPKGALEVARDPGLAGLMARFDPRADKVLWTPLCRVFSDRPRALCGAWYELFPRSQGRVPGKASTLREAEWRLDDIKAMGFDVLYLSPIHPIGVTDRKGPNNSLDCRDGDPGCPWAIGSSDGGHTAVEPSLGSLDDFGHFVAVASERGLEIALDFAVQCSPDHPWVTEHPQWFHHRPDGTIKFAENPPKKYQDVYPVNFDTEDREGLWQEQLRVLRFWIANGVKIFRVDNPHTKPLCFWEWVIGELRKQHPDVIFLSEAFTRPKMMKALAKLGFTQSYTYFTWRTTKWELVEYINELTQSEMRHYFRPNFFTNTPDVLPYHLQRRGRAAFKIRHLLAATLSPSYGIYSGFELCENEPVDGCEEYLNSEKYQIKTRDWDRPGNIKAFISKVNGIRRDNPALQELGNLRFLDADSDQILFYAKKRADNIILVAVNLDPDNTHHATVWVPEDVAGVKRGGRYQVVDLLTGATHQWGQQNFVRLCPGDEPAHIFRVLRHS